MELQDYIKDCEQLGCIDCSNSLGIQKMPEGYALILNSDQTHYFWINDKGVESCTHWDRWAVYRGAVLDSKNNRPSSNSNQSD